MKYKVFWMLFLLCAFAKAQQESSCWYFGINAGIDFSSGTPQPLSDGQIVTLEGCATISDRSGNLLFYTDGTSVYNRDNALMPNGDDLKGDSSSTSSAIIVPIPNDPSRYYIITVDTDDNRYRNNEGMFYSVVDMNLDNGNGDIDVFEKNINLLTLTSEKLTSVKNATDDGYWILTQFEDRFYAYELTSSGLNTSPVVSTVDPFIELITSSITNVDVSAMRGYIKLNSAGDKLVAAHFSNNSTSEFSGITDVTTARSLAYNNGGELYLYDFDNATGIVSNPVPLATKQDGGSYYGVEFSSDNRYLYTEADYLIPSTTQVINLDRAEIQRFDLTSSNIAASKEVLYTDDTNTLRGALQIGLDGNIYHATIGLESLARIENPNDPNATYEQNAFALAPGTLSQYGLPIFVQSFIVNADINGEDSCLGDPAQFSASSPDSILSIEWNFGDPASGNDNTSTLINPEHTFTTTGDFTVTAEITTAFGVTIQSITVSVFPDVVVNPFQDSFTVCNEGFEIGTFDLTSVITELEQDVDNQTIELYPSEEHAQNQTSPITDISAINNTTNPETIAVHIANDNCEEILPIYLAIENCDVEIFNILTPNEDGKNDEFVITGLRNIYFNHKLSIYNRYGAKVWEGDNDDSPWNGTANTGLLSTGEVLPSGTYFYILDFNEAEKEPKSGYVYLH
ncbi:hypothetical protein BST97_05095 [Nonlabens spongiae]|uniref:PKD domain-containing protein n=1 Tax=Nonlabens spongiae TaxID=331648 RepID=A0A1W6MIH0_9FLAO|nr:gliding motility-associated C-terminal domain-containing protein [Nonlabens spongiae]ARN77408.1 hypothetical protein BST97_05095 [Nonlabens spongiae]